MNHWYEIWDREGGNLVGEFDSTALALDFVRKYTEQNGPEPTFSWIMVEEGEDGDRESVLVASGHHLLDLAQKPDSFVRR